MTEAQERDLEVRRTQIRQAIERVWEIDLPERPPVNVFQLPPATGLNDDQRD